MNPTIVGVMGPGFLNQVPTLDFPGLDFGAKGSLGSSSLSCGIVKASCHATCFV